MIINLLPHLAFMLIFGRTVYSDPSCACGSTISSSFIDVAIDMMQKAKLNMPTCSAACKTHNTTQKPLDCSDVLRMGHNKSGVYTIWPITRMTDHKSLDVYCDMKTGGGGWIVIQRRGNFGRAVDYFFKDWKSYKEGFGDKEKDFWLGNDNIFALTNQRQYSVRFDLKDVENNKRYAHYNSFWISDGFSDYTLHISGYSGDAGDSMIYHNNQKFSTKSHDNSEFRNCTERRKGGWWYKNCYKANLNGLYRRGKHNDKEDDGIAWYYWKGNKESLASTEIKIRPKTLLVTH